MNKPLAALSLAALGLSLSAIGSAQNVFTYDGRPEALSTPKLGLNAQDKRYFREAAASNKFEIVSSQLALSRSKNRMVLDHAKMMVADHVPAYEDLRLIAKRKNFALPGALPAKQQAIVNRLSRLSGAEFDRYYVQTQLSGHQDTSIRTKRQIQNGRDEDLKGFAVKSLPTILEHLQHAKMHKDHMGM